MKTAPFLHIGPILAICLTIFLKWSCQSTVMRMCPHSNLTWQASGQGLEDRGRQVRLSEFPLYILKLAP